MPEYLSAVRPSVLMGNLPARVPSAFPRVFSAWFKGSEGLGTDHRGRRLLADLDGRGALEVLSTPPGLEVLADGRPSTPFARFEEDLVATASGEGEFACLIHLGDPGLMPQKDEIHGTAHAMEGAGWALWDGSPLWRDGLDEPLAAPLTEARWIPFLDGFQAASLTPFHGLPSRTIPLGRIVPAARIGDWPWKVKNGSAPQVLASLNAAGILVEAPVMSHLNPMEMEIALPECEGAVRLVKTYDAFHGRQRARVMVDGLHAGWWHLSLQDRIRRWRTGDFLIPEELTAGKRTVSVAIDPPAGVALWSVGELRAELHCPAAGGG